MSMTIAEYNQAQSPEMRVICEKLQDIISKELPEMESKIWHGGPVWFDKGNPLTGYWVRKSGVQLMFWSGADFEEPELKPGSGKFKDASITYISVDEINEATLQRWLEKAKTIQWDYKNVIKRKGVLEKL